MPVYFGGPSTAERTATADAELETVVSALKAEGFERVTPSRFAISARPGESRSLFGGRVRFSSQADGQAQFGVVVDLRRHTPALRPWRRDSQTKATITVTVETGQQMRFLEMKAVDLAASSIATRVASAIEEISREVATPAIG